MTVKTLAAVGVSAVTMMAGTAPAADAATSVTAAIKGQDAVLRHDASVKALAHFHVSTPEQARKLVPKVEAAARALDRSATVVSHASASSAAQKAGQRTGLAARAGWLVDLCS